MDTFDEAQVVYDDYRPPKSKDGRVRLANPHLQNLTSDHLYHLALDTVNHDLRAMFGDVKFVCMGGTEKRMQSFARFVAEELCIEEPLVDLAQASNRYSLYKVGPVLSISHGMGCGSISILLHEIIKLMHYAECSNVTFFRLGTSGGIGVPPGTVVISNRGFNELLRPYYELNIMNKIVRRPTNFDPSLIEELKQVAQSMETDYETVVGGTMCARDFYEAQSRLDGAICGYSERDKQNRLEELKSAGVVNIEMEVTTFASMCHYVGIPAAVVCVTLLNRLDGDQVTSSKQTLTEFQTRPQKLLMTFIKKRLNSNKN